MTGKRSFLRENGGIAMTETALLCLFLYVPMLMMVIIWGDMTLDKMRAHMAGAYLAFSGRPPDAERLRSVFFPGADGMEDGTGAVRSAEIELARLTEGPRYVLPRTRAGDYIGDPPDHDLQFRLYSVAQGRIWITTHVDASGGDVDFVYRTHQSRNEMARYLSREGVIELGDLPDDIVVGPGDSVDLDTGVDSRAYSEYVEVLTGMFNDALTGGRLPRGEVMAVWHTRYRSPFFGELGRGYDPRSLRGRTLAGGLPRFFEMQLGPPEELALPWREDEGFHTGYAYLRHPAVHPDGDHLLEDLAAIGIGATVPEAETMFRDFVDGRDVNPAAMWRLSALSQESGPDHERFLRPGDPRD